MSFPAAPISDAKEKTISLRTNDDRVFTLPRRAIALSFTISATLRDLGVDKYTDFFEEIPLPDVSGPIFEKVVEWCLHHMDDPPYAPIDPHEERLDDISEWDQDFLNVELPILFEMIMAANELDIKALLRTCSIAYANMMTVELKDMPVDELMATFNIENDFMPEEIEELLDEDVWCVNEFD